MKELMNEGMNDMKRVMMIMVLGALMACLVPATAQNTQDWQTATMKGSGSAYAPQVTAVGAASAASEATTTESYSPAKAPGGPRRIGNFGTPADTERDEESPIGDAVLPLLLFAAAYAAYSASRVYRRKRSV